MNDNQLLMDLAMAEKNMKSRSRKKSRYFFTRLTEAFENTRSHSFCDLIETDLELARELRDLAKKEKLI